MTVIPFPSVQRKPTHGHPSVLLDAPASEPPAELRGGTLTAAQAEALIRTPGDASDAVLAKACRLVQRKHGPNTRENIHAGMLLKTIPATEGGDRK